ncbi:hypothetical protein [Sulfitobacter sp. 1A12779]|uniref:hypothetical protein n=1 Tax=Sulfitobacter TaxID=60136 RepID=UPI0037471300
MKLTKFDENDEVKKYSRHRDWIPISVVAATIGIGYFQNMNFSSLGFADAALFFSSYAILWSVLDIRVMLARHHWIILRKQSQVE